MNCYFRENVFLRLLKLFVFVCFVVASLSLLQKYFVSNKPLILTQNIQKDEICVNFALGQNYTRNIKPAYDKDTPDRSKRLYQHDVYNMAASLAKEFKKKWIIDIGCGNGYKAKRLYNAGFNIVALDVGSNFKQSFDLFKGMEEAFVHKINLNTDIITSHMLPDYIVRNSILISADVIEHIIQPDNLIRNIKILIDRGAFAAVLSTPDRDIMQRLYWKGKPISPPVRQFDVQVWSASEFVTFLKCQDIPKNKIHTFHRKSRTGSSEITGIMVVISSCSIPTVQFEIENTLYDTDNHKLRQKLLFDF